MKRLLFIVSILLCAELWSSCGNARDFADVPVAGALFPVDQCGGQLLVLKDIPSPYSTAQGYHVKTAYLIRYSEAEPFVYTDGLIKVREDAPWVEVIRIIDAYNGKESLHDTTPVVRCQIKKC